MSVVILELWHMFLSVTEKVIKKKNFNTNWIRIVKNILNPIIFNEMMKPCFNWHNDCIQRATESLPFFKMLMFFEKRLSCSPLILKAQYES